LLALQATYPEHEWSRKNVHPIGYWKDIKNQRHFFEQLAIKLNIQKPEDWYGVLRSTILKEGAYFVSSYYNGSLVKGTKDKF
jgi:hypothetical protein